jgi:hypothetical protein
MDRNNKQTELYSDNSRSSVSVHRNLSRTWFGKSNNHSKNNRSNKYNRHNFHFLAVILSVLSPALVQQRVLAETVGGVSATAAPVANSSGSVTNQAIQVLQGPYITNTYGNGIQCQGPTRNFTPYVTGSASATKPWEPYYDSPVYDMRDFKGAFDDEGNEIGDGAPDNPGSILYQVPTRTGQKDNYNLGVGFSITWSEPLDKELQKKCKEAASANIALMQQQVANKRLDFEIARLKNCGELMKQGISFHPKSPYYKVCADVVVRDVTYIKPHVHSIPSSSPSPSQTSTLQSLDSDPSALLGAPLQIKSSIPSP